MSKHITAASSDLVNRFDIGQKFKSFPHLLSFSFIYRLSSLLSQIILNSVQSPLLGTVPQTLSPPLCCVINLEAQTLRKLKHLHQRATDLQAVPQGGKTPTTHPPAPGQVHQGTEACHRGRPAALTQALQKHGLMHCADYQTTSLIHLDEDYLVNVQNSWLIRL